MGFGLFQYNHSSNMGCHPRSRGRNHHPLAIHRLQAMLIKFKRVLIARYTVMMIEIDDEIVSLETSGKAGNRSGNAMMREELSKFDIADDFDFFFSIKNEILCREGERGFIGNGRE